MPTPQDVRFAREAVKLSFITEAQAAECLKIVEQVEEDGIAATLADVLLEKNYLTAEQCLQVRDALGEPVPEKRKITQLGNFKLTGKIGEGAMGVLYKAVQLSTGRTVAIKVLPPRLAADKQFLERFYREGTAVCKLNHAHIVQGIEVGMAEGYHFFAMEFVDGESVQSMLRRQGPLSEPQALQIALGAARGLAHAHAAGMVHRDIKPDNILLTREGVAKLADLGLAGEAGEAHLTTAGTTFGTPHYMSPEQARGTGSVDIRSDLYSLGATLYRMVIGEPPYPGDSAVAVMTKHLNEPVPDPKRKNPSLSDGLCALIRKLMAKDPAERYQSPEELIKDLQLLMEGKLPPSLAPPPSPAAPSVRADLGTPLTGARPSRSGSLRAVIIGGTLLGVIIIGVVILLSLKHRPGGEAAEPVPTAPAEATGLTPAQEAYAYIQALLKEHPEDYTGTIDKLTAFVERFKGTAESFKAEENLKSLTATWQAKGLAEAERLKAEAARLVDAGRYSEAFALLELPEPLRSNKALDALHGASAALLRQATEQLGAQARKLIDEGRFAEALRLLNASAAGDLLEPVAGLKSEVERSAQARFDALHAELAAAVPALKGDQPAEGHASPEAILAARNKLEEVILWQVPQVVELARADLDRLRDLESQSATARIPELLEKSALARRDAVSALREENLDAAPAALDAAIAEDEAAAGALDENSSAPLRIEIAALRQLQADFALLRKLRDVALEHADELVGKAVAVGSVTGTVQKIEGGKVFISANEAVIGKDLRELPLRTLAGVALSHAPDEPTRAEQALLLELYAGTLEQLRRAIDAAQKAGVDTAHAEARAKELEQALVKPTPRPAPIPTPDKEAELAKALAEEEKSNRDRLKAAGGVLILVRKDRRGDVRTLADALKLAVSTAKRVRRGTVPAIEIVLDDSGTYSEKLLELGGLPPLTLRATLGQHPTVKAVVNIDRGGALLLRGLHFVDSSITDRGSYDARRYENCEFDNTSVSGYDTFENCTFRNYPGTALTLTWPGSAKDCSFLQVGTAVSANYGYPTACTLSNCLIVATKTALRFQNPAGARVLHCTIVPGRPTPTNPRPEFGILCTDKASLRLDATIIAGFQTGVSAAGCPDLAGKQNDLWNQKDYDHCQPFDGDLRMNPVFANPAKADYRLTEDSPLKGKSEDGSDLGVRFNDNGEPQSVK